MEPPFADSSDVSLALVGPSNSGTDWANRDRESLYRRPGASSAPYRRPPAATPLRDEKEDMSDTGSWNAFAAPSTGRREPAPDVSRPGWETERDRSQPDRSPLDFSQADRSPLDFSRPDRSQADRSQADRSQADRSPADRSQPVREPEFGPAPPATGGRTAFGVSAGPISGNWRNEAPASPAGGGLPIRSTPAAEAGHASRTVPAADAGYPGWTTASHAAGAGRPTSGHPYGAEAAPERSRHSRPAPPAEHDDGVGDFIGGPGREIRPHRAAKHPAPPAAPAGLEPPRRSRGVMLAGLALTTAVLLGATVAGVAYFSGPDKDLTSVLELGAGDKTDKRTASAAVEGRTAAGFDLVSAVTRVTVRSEDLGDRLFSVTTADDSGILPKPVLAQDKVQLYLTPDGGDNATGAVDVVLTTRVTWMLRFSGSADEQILNLRGGRVAGIEMLGGARRTAIQLPAAAGTVPLTVTGAVDELAMTSPAGNPVRVQVKGGAKTVAAGARTLRDVAPGSTLTPKNWATNDRYDVNAEARVTLLSVETVK
ncbi:hypothetical protein [Actinoplanes sp. NPDC049316]|uniref:hypothetical protein n=1 Tax=Actinoplanes sp. NPDC049316 TaxID=3154727 RepID=UPI003418B713